MVQEILEFLSELPDFVQITIAIILTIIAAKTTAFVVTVGFKHIVRKTNTDLDDQIADALQKPLFYSIVFGGLAFIALLPEFVEPYEGRILAVFYTLLVFMWTMFSITFVRIVTRHFAHDTSHAAVIKPETAPLFENLFVIIASAMAVYVIFSIWGINMTAWLASAGVVGIAVGFAAKDTLANMFSGIFILADAPYKIGDYIVLDSAERGKVVNVGIRSTRILTRDDVEVTIPNAVMSSAKIVNESGGPVDRYRVRAEVSVSYQSDVDVVERVLLKIAEAEERTAQKPAPRVRFRSFGSSGLEFTLLVWIKRPEDRAITLHHLNRAIYKQFKQEHIEIPFPQQDVHIKEMPR